MSETKAVYDVNSKNLGTITMKCENCRFFARSEECHRRSPITVTMYHRIFTAWPAVHRNDWCGDYERR